LKNRTLLRTGLVGAAVAALCCFTPIVVAIAGAVGLSAWVRRLDFVLMFGLMLFLGITIYALMRSRDEAACCTVPGRPEADTLAGRR
jgi:mercuric ion transport protein